MARFPHRPVLACNDRMRFDQQPRFADWLLEAIWLKILVAGGVDEQGEGGQVLAQFATRLAAPSCAVEMCCSAAVGPSSTRSWPKRPLRPPSRGASTRNSEFASWITSETKPIHAVGRRTRSVVGNWGQIPRGYAFPEPVREADFVVIVGGWNGTHFAATWARIANKPLLPVATFGGAAKEIYNEELDRSRRNGNLTDEEFQVLNSVVDEEDKEGLQAYAERIVALAEQAALSKEVFVVMSFEQRPELVDAFNTFKRVCEKHNLKAIKIDNHLDVKMNIVPSIFSRIRSSAFVIAELSAAKPNVYYEIGYARALGKAVIHTAKEGTPLPFDVFDIPTLFYDGQTALETKLDEAIGGLLIP